MGLTNKEQYVSTVSGGSWFYSLYSYSQLEDPTLAGLGISCGLIHGSDIPDPGSITLDELKNKNLNKNFATPFSDDNMYKYITQSMFDSTLEYDELWKYGVGKLLLSPYNLYDTNRSISLNKEHAINIVDRNNKFKLPYYLPDNMPYWISTGMFMLESPDNYPFVPVEFTPLYSGIKNKLSNSYGNKIGGYLVETFAFGNSEAPPNIDISKINECLPIIKSLNKNPEFSIRSIDDIISVSSIAFASILYNSFNIRNILPNGTNSILPTYIFWSTKPLLLTCSDSQCSINLLNGKCESTPG